VPVETVLTRGGGGSVDTRELRKLTQAFRGWKPDKALHKQLRRAADEIAIDARAIAVANSNTIPPTVKVRVSKTRLSVVAGGHGVAIAGLFELGNKSGGSKSRAASRGGKFRHPVYGNRSVWVDQDMHPYLLPAALKNRRKVEDMVGEAVREAFRESGLKMS
jgi:hypothetical protein